MWKKFKQDALRWVEQGQIPKTTAIGLLTILKLLYYSVSLRAMLLFRFGGWCKEKGIPFLPFFIQKRLFYWYGLEIGVGQNIGGGLYIAHPSGTVIFADAIGENCSIIASVTIGMRNEWAFPQIGDRVFIGAGARVLGAIAVGNDARVGANAVVINDVPPGSTVVGIPAKVIK